MASKDAGTGNVDEPKSKGDEVFILDGNVMKIVDEALLEYFGHGYKSHIEIAPNAKIVPHLSYFDGKLFDMQVLDDNSFVAPTINLENLQFLRNLPPNEALYKHDNGDGTVIYEFLIFESNDTKLSSPYLDKKGAKEDHKIHCKSDSIGNSLKQINPREALVKDLGEFFSLEGKPSEDAFKWKQDGGDLDFAISKEMEDKTFYWRFTGINKEAEVSTKHPLHARLNEKVDS